MKILLFDRHRSKHLFPSVSFFVLVIAAWLIFSIVPGSIMAADNEFRVGILTTFKLEAGDGHIKAVEMAVEEINAKGGILGKQVKVFKADDEGIPEKGIMALKRLVEKDRVHFLIGGAMSGVVLASMEYLKSYDVIFMNAGSSAPVISEQIVKDYDKYKYQFRITMNAINIANAIVQDGLAPMIGRGYKRFAILAEDAAWNRGLVAFLQQSVPKIGGTIVTVVNFDPKTTDFAPVFFKIDPKKVDVAITLFAHTNTIILYKQWYETKAPFRMVGFNNAGCEATYWQKTGGACLSEANMCTGATIRANITPKSIPFHDGYLKKYGAPPQVCASIAYDGMYSIAEAAKLAKSFDTTALIKALEEVDFQGAGGRVVFDKKTHDAKYSPDHLPVIITQWQKDGKWVILAPKKYATGEFVNPPWLK